MLVVEVGYEVAETSGESIVLSKKAFKVSERLKE